MTVAVLDTHALLWWVLMPERLGSRAAPTIAASDRLGVPTIVFWELSLLARKRKVALGLPIAEWVAKVCAIPRVAPLPLTVEIAVRADGLSMHADPADRFIAATAIEHGAPLVTKDRLVRRLRGAKTIW